MLQALWIVLALIALALAGYFAYWMATQFSQTIETHKKTSQQGVVKHDWLPTGRIDFATRLDAATDENKERTDDFKLLVEERRIVESIAGNENLEIQWRLATLGEAKTVVTQYHKYLFENSLIKSIPDHSASSSSSMTSQGASSGQQQVSLVPSADSESGIPSHSAERRETASKGKAPFAQRS
jgi:DNA-binding transcriptional regulator of glucitol operon